LSPLDVGHIVTVISLLIAVLKLYMDQRKAKKELELTKQYLQTLSELVKSYREGIKSQQQLEKEKLQWQRLRDIAKLFGWFIEYSEENG